jgi:hypothetical protein
MQPDTSDKLANDGHDTPSLAHDWKRRCGTALAPNSFCKTDSGPAAPVLFFDGIILAQNNLLRFTIGAAED